MTEHEKDLYIQELQGIRSRQGSEIESLRRQLQLSMKDTTDQFDGKLIFAALFVISLIINIIQWVN